MKLKLVIALLLCSLTTGMAFPDDTIFTSTNERALIGEITGMTPTVISFKPLKDGPSEIAVNEIKPHHVLQLAARSHGGATAHARRGI